MSFEVPDWDNSETFSYYNTPSVDTLNIVNKVEGQKGKRYLSDSSSAQAVKKTKISIAENTPAEVVSIEDKKKAKKKRQKELAAQRKKNEEAEQKQSNNTAAANDNGHEVASQKKEKKCKNKYKQLSFEQRKRKEMENAEKQMSNGTETTETDNVAPTQKKKRKNSDTDKEPITVKSVENEEINKITKKEKKKKQMKQLNGTVNDAATISESLTNKEEELPETPKKKKKKSKKKNKLITDALEMAENNIEEADIDGEEKKLLQSSKKKNKRKAEKKLNGNAQAMEVLGNNTNEDEVGPLQKKKQKKKKKKVDRKEEEPMQENDSEQEVTEYKIKEQKNKNSKSTTKNKENAKKKDVKSGDGKGKPNSKKEKKKKNSDNNVDEAEDLNDPSFQSDLDTLLKKLNFEHLPADILTLKDSDVQDMEEGSESLAESDIDTDDLYASTDEDEDDDDNEDDDHDDHDDDDSDVEEEDKNVQMKRHSNQNEEQVPQKGIPDENKKKIEAKSDPPATKKISSPQNKELQVSKQEKSTKLAQKGAVKETKTSPNKENPPMNSAEALRQKMMDRLKGAQFRMMNEQLYTKTSKNAVQKFKDDTEAFKRYHEGFQTQVALWPVNPLDRIITWIKKKPRDWVVADFGCGEARLAASVPQEQVHSFDLVAVNERVTACDMAKTPLKASSVDVVVFCLSLMGTNVKDFLVEANRVLKIGGIMKIAEVESRFTAVHKFVTDVCSLGFDCINKEIKQKYFHKFDFRKISNCNKGKIPNIELKPCIYKKR